MKRSLPFFVWTIFIGGACADGKFSASTGPATTQESTVSATSEYLDRACANATPVFASSGAVFYLSPTTYSPADCFKGQVVEMDAPLAISDGSGGHLTGAGGHVSGSSDIALRVGWADVQPNTQASCESAWLASYLFERDPNGNWIVLDFKATRGTWFLNQCSIPQVVFFGKDSGNYRLAASARTAQTTGAPTRALYVSSG